MVHKKTDDEHLEGLMNQLADSVLGLSNEAIFAEAGEGGDDPDEEAERTRLVLHAVCTAWTLTGACPESVQNPIHGRKASSRNGEVA